MKDVPPRVTRLILGAYGLAATALGVATYCLTDHWGAV